MRNIEEEYKTHQLPEDIHQIIQNPYDFVLSIDNLIKKFEREQRKLVRRIGRNALAQKLFFADKEILAAEGEQLNTLDDIIDDNLSILVEVLEALTDDNFPELMKMVDFQVSHYLENRGYIGGRIEALCQSVNGFGYFDYRYENTHPAVKEFLTKKLEAMKKQKQLEKKPEV